MSYIKTLLKLWGAGIAFTLLSCVLSLVLFGEFHFRSILSVLWIIDFFFIASSILLTIKLLFFFWLDIKAIFVIILGIIFVFFSWTPLFLNWGTDVEVLLMICLFLYGIFIIYVGNDLLDKEKKEELSRWDKAYSDPQWRKKNPKKAAAVELERQRVHRMWNGPAVRIYNLQQGHYDHRRDSWSSWANSAGGWSVRYTISNIGARKIKYVVITLAAYNAVGDKCYCSLRKDTDIKCRYTGPLEPGTSTGLVLHENLWYDISMHGVSIEHIHIDFMDGNSQDITKDGKVYNHGF